MTVLSSWLLLGGLLLLLTMSLHRPASASFARSIGRRSHANDVFIIQRTNDKPLSPVIFGE